MKIRRKTKIFWLVFLLVIAALILIVYFNIDFFKGNIDKYVQIYGLPAVFVFAFLTDLLEQPIGPEVPAGFALALGLEFLPVFIIAVIGSYTASLINFYIGKRILSKKVHKSFSPEEYKKYHMMFLKWGNLALVIAAVSPVPYVIFCWLAGSFHMKLRNFVFFGLIPRAFRIGVVLLIVLGIISL